MFEDKNYPYSKTGEIFYDATIEKKEDGAINHVEKSTSNPSILHLEEEYKFKILRNQMKVIMFVNILPLCIYIFGLAYPEWYLICSNENSNYWMGLLRVYDKSNNDLMPFDIFKDNQCKQRNVCNNQSFCDFIVNFQMAGFVCFLFILIGILLHVYSIIQMILIVKQKENVVKSNLCFRPKIVQATMVFCYFAGLFFWVFTSGILFQDFKDLGVSILLCVLAYIIVVILVIIFYHLKREIKKQKLVSRLLYPDI